MNAPDAGAQPDPGFLEFARARQGFLLHAAYLVSADPGAAAGILRSSLVALAREWKGVGEEHPDLCVRRPLYRDAIAQWRTSDPPDRSAADESPEPPLDDADDWRTLDERHRREVMASLDALTPRQRAALVLAVFEERPDPEAAAVLGLGIGAFEAERAAAIGLAPLTHAELAMAADDLAEVDVAPEAWLQAAHDRRRLRRRAVLGVSAVAALGAVGVVAARRPGEAARSVAPSPTTSPTPSAPAGALPVVGFEGVRVSLAPAAALEGDLPRYADAQSLALPAVLGPNQSPAHPVLGEGVIRGVAESVRAVFLVHALGGGYEPVVHVPASGAPHLVVPSVRLGAGDATDDQVPVLGPRTIAEDRHRLVFAQPGAVTVFDARDASTTRVDVPDPTLSSAGWARDGATVIARGATASWLVDTRTGTVTQARGPVSSEWVDLVDVGPVSLLRSYSGSGELTGTREMRGPSISPTSVPVANTEGWVAVGASLSASLARAIERPAGLVVVQGDLRPTPRVLAATADRAGEPPPYTPRAWGPGDVALIESLSLDADTGAPVRRLLAWDLIPGRLSQVSEIEAESPDVGGFAGAWAI